MHIGIIVAVAIGLLFHFAIYDGYAQGSSIRGRIVESGSQVPLTGATIVLRKAGKVVTGTAADRDGFYLIRGLQPETFEIIVSFIGYSSSRYTVEIEGAADLRYDVALKRTQVPLEEVIISAGAGETPVELDAGIGTAISPTEIGHIPAPDVSGDLASFLSALPGVLTTGDRGGQLFVQGGEATHNLVLLDGLPVFQPFHLIGYFSALPADIIQQVQFFGAGYGPKYGGYLSAVVDASTRVGKLDRFTGSVSGSPFVGSIQIEGPVVPRRASFLVSVRQSTIERFAPHLIGTELPFEFGDRFAKLYARTSPNSSLSVSGIQTFDRGTMASTKLASDNLEWRSDAIGIRHVLFPNKLPMKSEVVAFYSRLQSSFGGSESARSSSIRRFGGKASSTLYLNRADIHFGASVGTTSLEYSLSGLFQNYDAGQEHVTEAAIYIAPEVSVAGQASISAGLRLQSFPSKKSTFFEPRLSAIWERSAHQLVGSLGIYHQQMVGLTDKRDPANIFVAWTASPVARVPSSQHLTLGYRIRPTSWIEASFNAFSKKSEDIQVAKWIPEPSFSTEIDPVDASARGIELKVRIDGGFFRTTVGYGLSDVFYAAQLDNISNWYGPTEYVPPHNRRHKLSVLGVAKWKSLHLNLQWQYGSGASYSQPIGFDEFILMDSAIDPFSEPGTRRIIYRLPYGAFMPSYHRLDISAKHTLTWKKATLTLHAALINVYDRANILYMDLYTGRRMDQLPFFPSFGIKVSL